MVFCLDIWPSSVELAMDSVLRQSHFERGLTFALKRPYSQSAAGWATVVAVLLV